MAWLRTSVSLYAFGFSLTKFFDYVAEGMEDQTWTGPERLGLALLGLGMLVLILGAIQHRRRVRRMKQLGLPVLSRFSLPIGAAAALLAIGLTTLLGIAFP
jgi:putative membrane protein